MISHHTLESCLSYHFVYIWGFYNSERDSFGLVRGNLWRVPNCHSSSEPSAAWDSRSLQTPSITQKSSPRHYPKYLLANGYVLGGKTSKLCFNIGHFDRKQCFLSCCCCAPLMRLERNKTTGLSHLQAYDLNWTSKLKYFAAMRVTITTHTCQGCYLASRGT